MKKNYSNPKIEMRLFNGESVSTASDIYLDSLQTWKEENPTGVLNNISYNDFIKFTY